MSATYRPYQVMDSGQTAEAIMAQVNEAQWYGYGPDYRAGGIDKVIASPLIDFETFLGELSAVDHFRFVTHRYLAANPEPEAGIVRIAIRHDIDSDIVSALAQAEIEARLGVAATWLVLHTAAYYGAFGNDGVFHRHDSMASSYRRLQDLGHEVSLHTDALGLYQLHGVDGAAAIETELAWLRSNGIDVVGTTAHNHRSTYGAENYEIFRDYVTPDGAGHPAEATAVSHEGASAPLRVLDATTLGLHYEGNEILWRRPEVDYCSARFVNEWAAPWFRRQRAQSDAPELRFVDQDRVVEHLLNLTPGQDAVVVIHPEYFGARAGVDQGPLLNPDPVGTQIPWSQAGWLHHEPWSVIVDRSDLPGRPTVGIAVANEWGRRGLPVAERLEVTEMSRRFVVVGGDHTDAPSVAVPAAWPERTARLLTHTTGQRWSGFVVADPTMGIDRLWPWLCFARSETEASTIVIEIPADIDANVGIERWAQSARATGSGGTYLVATPGGVAKRVFSPDVDSASDARSSARADTRALYSWCIERLRGEGCDVVLVLTAPTDAPRPAWIDEITSTNDRIRVVGPVPKPTNGSLLTFHRQLSDALAAELRDLHETGGLHRGAAPSSVAHGEVATGTMQANYGDELLDIDREREPTDGPPDADALAAQARARSGIGLCTYPPPFSGVVAFVSDIDGSTTGYYQRYMAEIVRDWGLDHGDSIHFAGYHQRYALDRRRIRSRHRAILNFQLRLDNTPIGLTGSWMAHVLRSYHRGDIDHLHGLYAWGARTLPLAVTTHPTKPSATRAINDFAQVRRSALARVRSLRPSRRGKLPYSVNASFFPIISCAVRTDPNVLMPDRITAQWPDSAIELYLVDAIEGPDRTRTSIYTAAVEHLSVMDVDDQPVLYPQRELLGIDIDIDASEVLGAALHNTDRRGVELVLEELRRRYRLAFDLLTTHGQYHFYAQGQLELMAKRAIRAQNRYRPEPIALYGAPRGADAALVAVADDEWSPAAIQHVLVEQGIRFLTPIGYIAKGQDPFDAAEVTFPVIDRAGSRLWYLQRCLPKVPSGVSHPNTSRLSTFELRLEGLLDDFDRRIEAGQEGGFWSFYTHLGQTTDLDEEPDPWFGGQGLAAVAQRFWGATPGARPWVTRASVLANYSQLLQRLPDVTTRDGDRIAISNSANVNIDDRPIQRTDLFGITFEVADAERAELILDGEPITEVYRWPDGKAITCVACGIRWPIVASVDPTKVAEIGGDLTAVEITSGTWTWRSADQNAPSHGSLAVGSDGMASLRIALDDLDVSGAQVVSVQLRAGDGISEVTIGLGTATGHRMVLSDHRSTDPQDHPLGHIGLDLPAQRWVDRHVPLWAATDVEPLPRTVSRSIRTVEIVIAGSPGATLDIGSLQLGRPKTNSVIAERGVLIGGEANTVPWVDIASFDGDQHHRCIVEPNGVFISPSLEPGAWILEAPDMAPRAIQVETNRFDVVFGPSELANPRARTGTKPRRRRRRLWPRRR